MTSPQIGIWWDDGERLYTHSHSPFDVEPIEGIFDSEASHVDLWHEAAMFFCKTKDAEYFSVPRGRIVWLRKDNKARIFHGNATTPDRLDVIAKAFSLQKWDAQTDIHYMMGDSVDDLFDD